MNKPVPVQPDPKLMAMTTEQRCDLLLKAGGRMTESVIEAAKIVYAMKMSGDNMEPARKVWGSQINLLLRIGCGQTLAETYLMLGKHPHLYRPVAKLDLVDQEQIAEGKRLPVLVYDPDGKQTVRMKAVTELDEEDAKQVFAPDHIRTEAEQASYLDRQNREKAKPVPEQMGRFHFDPARGTARSGNQTYTLAELEQAVKHLHKLMGKDR